MITNGWQKSSGIYKKKILNESVNLELNLLVNEEDQEKIKIANMIKEMAEQNGIKINVISKKGNELTEAINSKSYDILLATVNIGKVPDISFISEYLNVSDTINNAINMISSGNVEDIQTNIENLEDILSSEVACIGIMAKTSNIVYQKNINGFSKIGYMNIFNEFEKIGKIQSIKNNE